MNITTTLPGKNTYTTAIRILMVIAIVLGTFPFTISSAASSVLIEAHFDSGQDGFSYADDTFRGTNQPSYASGSWGSGYGYSGGGLRVYVGGVNTTTINGMSGGWSETFNLSSPETVTLSFRYQLTIASEYESDEYGQALFSLDGFLQGNGSNDYLAQIYGNGNGGSNDSTGWQQYIGQFSLSSGDHTITIGAYNNKKTYNNEWVEVLIDDVSVIAGNAVPNANAGPDQSIQDADQDGFELVSLDGSASYDIDGTIVTYHWSEGGLPLASGMAPVVNLPLGSHIITLTVTDDEGEVNSDQVEISITEPPEAQAIVERLDYGNFKSVIKSLNDFGDRCQMSGCSLTSYNNAQAWLEGQLSAMGYTVERHYYTYNSSTRASTYVTKVGTVHPDQMYMVACHLDGRGGGGAADDNGSGCALLFEGARVLAQQDVETDISIRFLFWGNEETGLHGSTQYRDDRYSLQGIEDPPGSGIYPEPTWLGNITHDMILYDHGVPAQSQQIAAADIDVEYRDGTSFEAQSRDLALYLQGANERYSTGIPSSPRHYPAEVNDYSTNTDDTPYHNYCPSISVRENRRLDEISGVHPYYHTSADVYENYSELDFQLGFNTVQMTIGAVAELAGARIISTNNPPVADSQSVITDEDTPIAITLTGFDPDSDPITFNVTSGPSQGSLTGSPPNVTYSPTPDFNGSDTFQFVVNDGTVNSSPATVSITVNPINDTPVADSQSTATSEGTPLAITLTGSDVDNDPLSFSVVTGPVNGSLTGTAPNLTYTPGPGISGADSFTFIVNDRTLNSNLATISITIIAVNDPPAADDQSLSTEEEVPLGIKLTGSDPENDPLSFNVTGGPSNGSLSGILPDLTYTPNADFYGSDSFTFVANDGEFDSAPATVSITVNPVNDAPVADDQAVTTDEDVPTSITLTGSDVDNDPLSFSINAGPSYGILSGTAPDLTYTPGENFFGADSFTFLVNDGTLDSAPATVDISIDPVNDQPVADPQSLSTNEDTALQITLSGSDVDGDGLTYNLETGPANGSLSGAAPDLTYTPDPDYNGQDSFTFIATDGSLESEPGMIVVTIHPVNDDPVAEPQSVITQQDTATAITLTASDVDDDSLTFNVSDMPTHGTLSGTAPDLTYIPDPGYIGTDNFTFTAFDGTIDSEETQVDITVTKVNHAPVADPQSVSADEDTPLGITLTGSDADGDPLTYAVTVQPTHGSLSGTAPTLTYTPDANYNSTDSFSFIVNDGLVDSDPATFNLTIDPVNDLPIANDQSVTTDEDIPLEITLSGSDIDGDPLSFLIVTGPSNGSLSGSAPNLTYIPAANSNGTDSFTFLVNDGTVDSVLTSVDITINPVNDQPVAEAQAVTTAEDTPVAITLVGSDIDDDPLTYSVASGPSNGTLSGSGTNLTYTPDANFYGSDSFTFITNDGSLDSAGAEVSLTITALDDTPVANDQSVITTEDSAIAIVLTGNDVDGDPLTYILVTGPANGVLVGTAPDLTYTPDANFNGADSFTFKVSDSLSDSNIATVSIDVTPVNDRPVADSQGVTTAEDTPVAITLTGSDIDGDNLTYQVIAGPSNGTLSGSGASLTYTPDVNFNGEDSFSFTASDGITASDPATVNITVTAVNDQPTAEDQSISTTQGTAVDITLAGLDIDGDPLTFRIVTGPASGSLTGTAPDLTYTPDSSYAGSDSFTFVVNDGTADSPVATVEITITPAGPSVVFEDDFETNKGWIEDPNNTDSATTGMWERANPETVDYNGYKQLGTTASGSYDLVTGPLAGSSAGSYDIDSGVTSIRSPQFNLPEGQVLTLSFAYYFAHASNSSSSDFLRVSVVGSSTQTVFEELGDSSDDDAAWETASVNLNAFAGQSVYLLIVAADNSTASLVEAAVDDVQVIAEPPNQVPTAKPQSVSTPEDTARAITLTGSDPEGELLTYSVVSGPGHGSLSGTAPNLTYTPAANYYGIDSFSFLVNDGKDDSSPATVSINVSPVNDAPVANSKTVNTQQDNAVAVTLTASDVDDDILTYVLLTPPSHGSLSGTAPNLTYAPAAGYNGSDSFTFKVNDGVLDSTPATVSITVTPPGPQTVFSDDFESASGWTRNPNGTDNATTGIWERANPESTSSSGTKQLGTTVSGSYDLVTGPLAGSSAGSYDIDGGVTSTRSPEFSLPTGQDITLSFYYYLAHASNSSSSDFLRVKVVGATTTSVFEELGAANNDDASWALFSASLNSYAGQTVYLLIEAADASEASLVEAGIDDVLVIAEPIIPSTTVLEATFDNNSDGFTYQDDTFRGSNQPDYASGSYQGSGGYAGGGLRVYLGGVNTSTISNMSGGWLDTFTLAESSEVVVTFYYLLTQSSEYESDEYSQALISVDGVLYGLSGNDYLAQVSGDGNGGSEISTGWTLAELNLGTLSAGEHTLIIGGYNNKKTYNNEWTEILIDNVVVYFR